MLCALSPCFSTFSRSFSFSFFFFNDTATTEIYTLSLHDALPISLSWHRHRNTGTEPARLLAITDTPLVSAFGLARLEEDRKSTRLNSSHVRISYAVFCLKKKKKKNNRLVLNAAP